MTSKPKVGEVLYMKTTEEPLLFVASRKLSPGDKRFPAEYEGSGEVYIVRRPIIQDGGVASYVFFDVLAEECATDSEMTLTRLRRQKETQELFRELQNELGGPESPAGPALVKN